MQGGSRPATCSIQTDAIETLAILGPAAKEALPDLIRLGGRSCIQGPTRLALEQIGTPAPEQLPSILNGLADRDAGVREGTLDFAQNLAPSLPGLIMNVPGPRPQRQRSVGAPGRARNAREVAPRRRRPFAAFKGYAADPSRERRERALHIIGAIGPDANAAVPLLEEYLKDTELGLQLEAARLLTRIEPAHAKARQVLVLLAGDSQSHIGEEAAAVLKTLSPADPAIEKALAPYAPFATERAACRRPGTTPPGTAPRKRPRPPRAGDPRGRRRRQRRARGREAPFSLLSPSGRLLAGSGHQHASGGGPSALVLERSAAEGSNARGDRARRSRLEPRAGHAGTLAGGSAFGNLERAAGHDDFYRLKTGAARETLGRGPSRASRDSAGRCYIAPISFVQEKATQGTDPRRKPMPERTCAYCHMKEKDWAAAGGAGFQKDNRWYCCQGCAEGLCTCTTDKIGTGAGAEWREAHASKPKRRPKS